MLHSFKRAAELRFSDQKLFKNKQENFNVCKKAYLRGHPGSQCSIFAIFGL